MLKHTGGRRVMQVWVLSERERLLWLELLLFYLLEDDFSRTLLVNLKNWVSQLHAPTCECQTVVLTFMWD